MFSRIVVPLDQSGRAERAIPVAARLARATRGEVILTHVLIVPLEYATPITPGAYAAPALDLLQTEAEDYLRRMADLPVLSDLHVSIDVSIGPTAIAILDTVEQHNADSIVMTTHGRTGFTRWALGSVARHVVRHAHVPVLAVREEGSSPFDAHGSPVIRALVPLDGSAIAEEAVEAAVRTVTALASPGRPGAITLAMIIDPTYAAAGYAPETLLRDGAVSYLERIAARLDHDYPGVKVSWLALGDRDVAAALVRLAEQGVADGVLAGESAPGVSDMIAMTTHGRTGVARLVLGSITERVLEISQLPLLVVRSANLQDAERDSVSVQEVTNPTPPQMQA